MKPSCRFPCTRAYVPPEYHLPPSLCAEKNSCPQTRCQCPCCACGMPPSCNHPPALPPRSFLLPRILACGREWLRRSAFTLQVEGIPSCAKSPYTLLSLSPCSNAPEATPLGSPSPWQKRLLVAVPVQCQVKDACGALYTGRAVVETEAALRLFAPECECCRNTLMILPCVRLVCPPPCAPCPAFDVQLEMILELYMTRWEACAAAPQKCAGESPSCTS